MNIEEFGSGSSENKSEKLLIKHKLRSREAGKVEEATPEDREENLNFGFSQWIILPNNEFRPISRSIQKLHSGYYETYLNNQGISTLCKKDIITDDLLLLDDISIEVTKEISKFWKKRNEFKSRGFSHRRGYLFYGRAGTGKSSIVKQIINSVINEQDGIVINCTSTGPYIIIKAIEQIRIVEPNRNILCIFEDIDSIIDEYGEQEILSLLDGENLIDYVLNIATTNYPERLDKRIVSRPRRFDRIIKIVEPNKEIRRKYFQEKLKVNDDEVEKYVEISNGFTYASLSDLVISTKCFDLSLEEAAFRLKQLEKKKSSDEYYSSEAGFGKL